LLLSCDFYIISHKYTFRQNFVGLFRKLIGMIIKIHKTIENYLRGYMKNLVVISSIFKYILVNFLLFVSMHSLTFATDINEHLIGYYPFNGNANDESGKDNHGQVYGATLKHGFIQYAYSFDGDDYIDIGNNQILQLTKDFTIMLWAYIKEDGSLVSKSIGYTETNLSTRGIEFYISNSAKAIVAYFWDTSQRYFRGYTKTIDHLRNSWIHVTLQHDSSLSEHQMRIFLNGEEEPLTFDYETTSSIPEIHNTEETMKIGCIRPGGTHFQGLMDEIRIYNCVLTKIDIIKLYFETKQLIDSDNDGVIDQWDNCPNTTIGSFVDKNGCPFLETVTEGLIAYYPLDKNSDDLSGNNNNGISNNVQFLDNQGIGGSCKFTREDNSMINIAVTEDSDLNIENDMTQLFWIKIEQQPTNGTNYMLSSKSNAKHSWYWAYGHRGGTGGTDITEFRFYLSNDGSSLSTSLFPYTIPINKWTFIGLVYESSKGKIYIYVDGHKKGETTDNKQSIFKNTDMFCIGGDSEGNTMNSLLDEFRIYNRTLSEIEILQIFSNDYNKTQDNCVFTDTDKDGVIDSLDICPDTPNLNAVFSNGCIATDLYQAINELSDENISLSNTIFENEQQISLLNESINYMYSKEQMTQMIKNILTWGDTNNDGKIGIEEAIEALMITSGIELPSNN